MGVATDAGEVTNSTTPTHFAFDYPVYLQNDTEYALVVETDSTDYELWVSRLGETDIATSTVITTQPSLGSVYRSQNIESWTEDIFEDLKFTLYRAEFDITRPAELLLKNVKFGYDFWMLIQLKQMQVLTPHLHLLYSKTTMQLLKLIIEIMDLKTVVNLMCSTELL